MVRFVKRTDAHGIVADSVVKTFGTVRALDGISLQVEPGTVFGLLGPNGAGKTTLVNVLTTLLLPDSGRATVGGMDVASHPGAVRRIIGVAGQATAVDDMLTGRENLVLVGRLNHLPGTLIRRRAAELLEDFDIADAADRIAKTYSGGMRRRLDLAAALMARPQVLFLDEPTTGLDPRSRIGLWRVIEKLAADGTTVLLTTQYLEEADRLARRIAVVDAGRVIAEGTAAELKSRLGGSIVEVRLADAPQAHRAHAALAGLAGADVSSSGTVVRVPTREGTRTLTEVVRRLDAAAIEVHGLQLREPSLDDVFLALTGRDVATVDESADAEAVTR